MLGRVPVLGVCYGAQLLAQQGGGEVLPATIREYGRARLASLDAASPLLREHARRTRRSGCRTATPFSTCRPATTSLPARRKWRWPPSKSKARTTYGIQFHPEVTHSTEGKQLLHNFVVNICECAQSWTPDHFVDSAVEALQNTIGPDDQVILGLSGGVDSSVAALLLHRAIGPRLHGIFVDNGLLRQDEFATVLKAYEGLGLNVTGVNAAPEFYAALAGICRPRGQAQGHRPHLY